MIHQCTFMSVGLYLLGFIHKRLPQKQWELGACIKKEADVCGQWTYDSSRRGHPLLIQFQNLTKTFDK